MKFWGAILLFFLYTTPVLATRELVISSPKSTLLGDEEVTISASASGFASGETIYFKGAFYKEGSINYFGLTKKSDSWVKNSATTTDQLSKIIGEWDSNLIIKSDYSDSGFTGNGDYLFKVGFYYFTSGGNLSSINWSDNNVPFSLTQPSPTPTSTPITPTSKPDPTSTPKPSSTPIPKPTSTPFSSPKPTAQAVKPPTPTPTPEPSLISLGQEEQISPVKLPESTSKILGESTTTPTPFPWTAALMIGTGLTGLVLSAFLLFRHPPSH